ncbi:MAG: twin-arginine translocase subunit TatC, partial [Pseudomonadota bacterium]
MVESIEAPADGPRDGLDDTQAPLIEHLRELRTRLIRSLIALVICVLGCWVFRQEIFQFLAQPLVDVLEPRGLQHNLIITSLTEQLYNDLRIAFYAGMFVAFPLIANQLWRFVAPGLYQDEQRAFWPFLVATPVLFGLGAALFFYIVAPLAFGFLVDYTIGEAATIYQRGPGDYHLFLNVEGCCSGVDSKYTIVTGRSSSPLGPFVDRDGERFDQVYPAAFELQPHLEQFPGELLLDGEGRYIGPGHAG